MGEEAIAQYFEHMQELYDPWRNVLINVGTTAIATLGAWGILRALDKLSHKDFGNDFFPVLMQSPWALSMYLSVRFACVLGFLAYQLGRFV